MGGMCKYRHIFGREGEGVHSYRLFNIAIIDLVMTAIGAYALAWYLESSPVGVFIVLMVISLFAHKAFCVETTLTKLVL